MLLNSTCVPSIEGSCWDLAGFYLCQSRKGLQPQSQGNHGAHVTFPYLQNHSFVRPFVLKFKFISLSRFLAIHIGKDILLIVNYHNVLKFFFRSSEKFYFLIIIRYCYILSQKILICKFGIQVTNTIECS